MYSQHSIYYLRNLSDASAAKVHRIEQTEFCIHPRDPTREGHVDFLQLVHHPPRIPTQDAVPPHGCTPSIENITLGKEALTAGHFGEVWEGTLGGNLVAVKVLKAFSSLDRTKLTKTFVREALVWRQLKHPNILPLYGLCCVGENQAKIGLVSPWMNNGDIRHYLSGNSSADRVSLVLDVARGLEYLHSKKPSIIHGDLKGANILVTDTHRACLADFGLSTASDLYRTNLSLFSTAHVPGAARWTAPELLEKDDARHSKESDVYAFALVCYEIFSGKIPFYEIRGDHRVIQAVVAGQRPQRPVLCEPHRIECIDIGLDDRMWRMLEQCWTTRPECRPEIREVSASLSTGSCIPSPGAPNLTNTLNALISAIVPDNKDGSAYHMRIFLRTLYRNNFSRLYLRPDMIGLILVSLSCAYTFICVQYVRKNQPRPDC